MTVAACGNDRYSSASACISQIKLRSEQPEVVVAAPSLCF